MNRLLVPCMMILTSFILGLSTTQAEPARRGDLSSTAPPVVRSGDFAVRLAETLGLGFIDDEVLAQSLLAARGIAPRGGWIANYPVTPLVMGELREALINSSESGRVDVTRAEALAAFDGLALELGLAVDDLAGQGYAEAPPPGGGLPPESLPTGEPPVAGYYDYHAEPPILAYYPPPPYYYGYYDYVPYPFFFAGAYHSGFFILRDFHRVQKHRHFGHKHHGQRYHWDNYRHDRRLISNQHFDRRLGRTVRVRPDTARRPGRFAETAGRGALDGVSEANRGGTAPSDRFSSSVRRDLGARGFTSTSRGGRESETLRRFPRSSGSMGRREGFWGSPEGFRRSDARFRSSEGFRERGVSRRSESFRGGGGDSFRSLRSSEGGGRGGGGPFRSFSSGGSGGGSGRGGGFSSRGGGGGRGGR